MKEFMLLILNTGKSKNDLSPEQFTRFLKKCEVYINNLKKEGKLISAQPLVTEGKIISGSANKWLEEVVHNSGELQVGYYHILAKDFDEAVAIAKNNPEFEYTKTARIEVRPVKMKEDTTGFVYPKNS